MVLAKCWVTGSTKIKPVHLVDVLGHSRLRPKLDEYMPQNVGDIDNTDSLELLVHCPFAAECLYDVLLIVCNKTEKVTAHSKDFIRKQLEKEM